VGNGADAVANKTQKALLARSGDVWLGLVIGAESTAGLLTPEANVAAGQADLSRTVRIIGRVVRRNWGL